MGNACDLLEGVGRGRMGRVVMGKLAMDVDLLEAIEELVKKERNRSDPLGHRGFEKSHFQEFKGIAP